MLKKQQVGGAVDAVLALLKGKSDSVSLVDQPKKIDLQFTLKHIPKQKHKIIPIDLPASLHYELREICIFVKDLDQKTREYEATVQHYEELFSKHKIKTITKIVPLKALRTDYSLPSSKISLAKAYDLYLADSSVMGLLPGILGKIFYAKKKTIPIKVNLGAKDLKKEIDRAVNNTRCVIQGSGSSCLVTVANERMDKDQIIGNVVAACRRLEEQVPGGKNNIRNMYVKSLDTTAVPLYIDLESANKAKLLAEKTVKVATYTDEVTTVENGQVMIRADGHVKVIRKKKNITDENKDKKDHKGKKGSGKAEDETEIKIKEEEIEATESQTLAKNVDDNSEPEIIDSDDDNKDDVQVEINKSKKSGKANKRRKKKSEGIKAVGPVQKPDEVEGDENDIEIVGSDNDNKDDVQVKIGKRKKSGKVGKKQKKRKSEGSVEDDEEKPVEKKKVKQTEIVSAKQDQNFGKKGPKKLGKKGNKAKSG